MTMMIKQRFETLLHEIHQHLSEELCTLNSGASEQDICTIEQHIGYRFPDELRQLYTAYNGQSGEAGLFLNWSFLSLDELKQEWDIWSAIEQQSAASAHEDTDSISVPLGYIKEQYCSQQWIPIAKDYGGNNYAIDIDPGPKGTRGQVIVFGRDYDTKYVLAESLGQYIGGLIRCLQLGQYELDEASIYIDPLTALTNDINRDTPLDQASITTWLEALEPAWQEALEKRCKKSLASFAHLEKLSSLTIFSGISTLHPLEKFPHLRELVASGTQLETLDGIQHCPELKKAVFGKNLATDIHAISTCANLQSLVLTNTPVNSIDPVLGLNKLKTLGLEGAGITNLTGLSELPSLKELAISNNDLTDISELLKLKKLTKLKIGRTPIRDASAFSHLSKLKFIEISETPINNLDFVSGMKNLVEIQLYGTEITDFSPLPCLPKLKTVLCSFQQFVAITKILKVKLHFIIRGGMTAEESDIYSNYVLS